MRLFICEFITGGGLRNQELPANLAKEGNMMLEALLVDLLALGITDIFTTRDNRLNALSLPVATVVIESDAYSVWQSCMDDADAVLIIAPESDDILYRLTLMAEQSACFNLGCTSDAVKTASSKIQTATLLNENNIDSIATDFLNNKVTSHDKNAWVIKPDDGVGADGCYFCEDNESLNKLITSINIKNFIIQKFQSGIPASLSMICYQGTAQLLSCNQQLFEFENGRGVLKGIVVNGLLDHWQEFNVLAHNIAQADTGLKGYIGVDLIITDSGPVVVEINPRLTTSYVGLRKSLSLNPAELIMSIWQNNAIPIIDKQSLLAVNLSLEEHVV